MKSKIFSAGFTLVEVAAVVVVGGIVLASATSMLNDNLKSSRVSVTQARMQDIDNALQLYLSVNGALPCPANLTDAPDSANFGRSITDKLQPFTITAATYATDTNDCYNNAESSGPDTYKTTSTYAPLVVASPVNTGNVVLGAVPVRSLNLPDQEIADAWGDRFVYAVTDHLTVFGNYNPLQGVIGIIDGTIPGNPVIGAKSNITPASYAQYVIVSYGADRAGANTLAGVTGVACPTAAANPYENTNCNLPTATFRTAQVVGNQASGKYFDDYVLYHAQVNPINSQGSDMPSGIILPFNYMPTTTTCPTNWSVYTGSGCTGSPCCMKN